nr:MAG TPA: hypothetical protein [Crassvirales sp.]
MEHKNDIFRCDCKLIDEIWNIKDVKEDVSEAGGLAVLPNSPSLPYHSL